MTKKSVYFNYINPERLNCGLIYIRIQFKLKTAFYGPVNDFFFGQEGYFFGNC